MKFFKNGIFKMDAFQIEVVNSIKKGTFSKKKKKKNTQMLVTSLKL